MVYVPTTYQISPLSCHYYASSSYLCSMKTNIDITTILSQDLRSRLAVNDLRLYIENAGSESVVIDFAGVKFATRSFVDEYYNVIMKNQSSIKIETINIPEDIQTIFDVVQRTQHKEKDIKLDATVVRCKTFADLKRVFSTLML